MSPVSILPAFFDEALKASYSAADVERIAAGLAQRRATTLRANALLTTRGEIAAALDAAGLPWEEVPWYGDAFVLGSTPASALWE
ncbi:MAG: RsmB/NOP family class I SAM-dependent RNA methyltransferase, partial [Coriobacteriaceae bacterium]|nr:RsmB/NOP family class I SAM-dependent RNA methyltransferase [Coriobacteriaceae bacterium]